ncbi:hypothetical protein [Azospirillum picis]|uniref:Uncharacterized protein n=1 Tax=Azospirillum picis TaxID=488438 RepID=A0ABU0MRX5_9PROT|nr:hypothetical protein [Azospirillum picis]MBP2302526.1 hypothetical protein [Azospirillum picis]MDQ0536232.1 hypothetical protein [Azospirillum picis]
MAITTVTAPAADRRLCSIADLKAELGIDANDTLFDVWLSTECLSASDRVAEACGVAADDDGEAPATFVQEIAAITFGAADIPNGNVLELPWRFPARVTSVTVAGQMLAPALYRPQPKAGLISRVDACGRPACWARAETSVAVVSGWEPGKVPTVLQDAVKRLVRLRWEAKDRDQLVKAEETDGVGRTEYWVGGTSANGSALPADVLASLQAAGYVNVVIA